MKIILIFKLILISLGVSAQELKKPRLDFSVACASKRFNNFTFKFDFSGVAFNADNKFIIQLSGANGDFSNATDLGTIENKNSAFFDIKGAFSLDKGTYGTSYKIRIKSTSPETIGPESDSFEAYYTTSGFLILNNYKPASICGPEGATIRLNDIGDDFTYNWYRNSRLISGQTESSITITQPGEYYASVNYGACGDLVKSNKVNVTSFSGDGVQIEGGNTVEICGGETYKFIANIKNNAFKYNWYKDGDLIEGLPDYSPSYTTSSSDQYGVYYVELESSNGCKSKSQDVTIKAPNGADFTVNSVGELERVLLRNETIVLTASHNSGSPSYQWYKNGVPLPARNQIEMNAVEQGVYYLEVTDNSTSCGTTKKSPEYKIVKPVKIVPILTLQDYTECESEKTKIILENVKAEADDGELYQLTAEQISKLGLQWYKNNSLIEGFVGKNLEIPSYQKNGEYYVRMSIDNLTGSSEKLNVFLIPSDLGIKNSSEFLCPESDVTLSTNVVSGYTYTWLKGEDEIQVSDPSSISVSDTGTYTLKIAGSSGCTKTYSVEIKEFNGNAVEVTPSTTAVLDEGSSVVISASGASSYKWYNKQGDLLSTEASVEIDKLGTYQLISTVGDCSITKDIEVVEDDGGVIIPNIVTPFNEDGANDKWVIPNRYAYQTDVTVIIYDSRGNEVLNTTDYQNNWPVDNTVKGGMLFYFKLIRDSALVKAGTLSILK